MNDKHNENQPDNNPEVLWTFKCDVCGFRVVKPCNDTGDRCPFCKGELVKTYFQFFN